MVALNASSASACRTRATRNGGALLRNFTKPKQRGFREDLSTSIQGLDTPLRAPVPRLRPSDSSQNKAQTTRWTLFTRQNLENSLSMSASEASQGK